MDENLIYYTPPKDNNGKEYWVPVVVTDKSYLCGYIDGMDITMINFDINSTFEPSLGSEKYNDILPSGIRIGDMTKTEFKNHIKNLIIEEKENHDLREMHPDHDYDILDYYFQINCTCGNFYGYNAPEELPEQNLYCNMCQKMLIEYTGKTDYDYQYDGAKIDVQDIVELVKKELNIIDEDDDE